MKHDVEIEPGVIIPAHEIQIVLGGSGGSSGHHMNDGELRVSLHWNIAASKALTDAQKKQVSAKLHSHLTNDGDFVIHSGSLASQEQNKRLAIEHFVDAVKEALHVPKERIPTEPPHRIREGGHDAKAQASAIRKMRSEDEED